METKHFTFMALCAVLFVFGIMLVKRKPKARDWLVGISVYVTTDMDRYDINLWGRDFYRAATRGVEFSIVDVIAAILIVTTPKRLRQRKPATYGLTLAYAAYGALSILTNEPMLFGTYELTKILRGLLILTAAAYYVTGPKQIRVLMLSVAVAVSYEGFMALNERYVDHVHRVSGTLGHPNNLSVFANFAAPLLLTAVLAEYPIRLKALFGIGFALCGACVLLSISRTGFAVFVLINLLVVICLVKMVRLTARQVAIGVVALSLAVGAVFRAKDSLIARYESATLESETESHEGRGMYFRLGAAVFNDHPFGVGLNNWSWVVTNVYYPRFGFPNKPYANTDVDFTGYTENEALYMVAPPAHNLWILTLGEVGIIGFSLFVIIWFRWLKLSRRFVRKVATNVESRYAAGVFFALLSLTFTTMTEYVYRHAQIFTFVHLLVGAMTGVVLSRQRWAAWRFARARAERRAAARRPPTVPAGTPVPQT